MRLFAACGPLRRASCARFRPQDQNSPTSHSHIASGLVRRRATLETGVVIDEEALWERIRQHAGERFMTKTGKPFTYEVPGNFLRVSRGGDEVNRSLFRTNFCKAARLMPTDGPAAIKDRQGPAYTWAILMDDRIRVSDW
jgi:hypothetical protein